MPNDAITLFQEFVRLDRRRRIGLSPEELQRWMLLKRALAKKFQPGLDAAADRRESIRVPTRLVVRFTNVGELISARMTNLGRGGVFIATDRPAELGTRLRLRIVIRATGEELELPAEVVSHNVGPDLTARSGMGVRFLELPPEVQKRLDDLYDGALRAAVEERAGGAGAQDAEPAEAPEAPVGSYASGPGRRPPGSR